MRERRPIKKVRQSSWMGGVMGGIAYAYGIPAFWLRVVIAIVWVFLPWPAAIALVIAYVLACVFVRDWDEEPTDFKERTS